MAPALQIERDLLARCSALRGKLCLPSLCSVRSLALEAIKASLLPNSLHWVAPKENSVGRSWCCAKLILGIGGNSFLCLDFLCGKHQLVRKWRNYSIFSDI